MFAEKRGAPTAASLTPCPAHATALFSRVPHVVGLQNSYELHLEVRIAPVCVFSNNVTRVLLILLFWYINILSKIIFQVN